ncbi:hypothetical protein PAHAL_4G163900 [Panicum hallii]|uniref:Uncharacterized protein n=1 Tax=Panicum hallii TaxID=206008 RepID=A0A2T8JD47_9POAL|nr:hypothetical protein PAHAL_4G163900 [Panicum hallii]
MVLPQLQGRWSCPASCGWRAFHCPYTPFHLGVPSAGGRRWSGVATRGSVDAFWPWFVRRACCSVATLFVTGGRLLARIMYCL